MRSFPILAVALVASCAHEDAHTYSPGRVEPPASASASPPAPASTTASVSVGQAEARAYGLSLINRDRAAAGLGALVLDDVASAAALRHVRDLAAHGVTAHWGTDGSVPEQRYTEAGGQHLVTENAACYADAKARTITSDGPFDRAAIDRFQLAFMAERPPTDGHRRNLLGKLHTAVGLAYATSPGSDVVCVVQELVDAYGTYGPIPAEAHDGDTIRVTGELRPPAQFGGVGLARAPAMVPRSSESLLATGGYTMPDPAIAYFPKGFKTPKPVDVDGNKFSIDLPLTGAGAGPGLYEVQVFARLPGAEPGRLAPVSLRTVRVP
jgi:uncharacterized protein YkwD